jgi:enoyl-CoA hydratase
MEKTGQVTLEVDQHIGIIRIDNPPGNYLVRPEFIPREILHHWIEESQLKGIMISGTGKHFSGGADLETLFSLSRDAAILETEMIKGIELLHFIEDLDIPVLAAINGICFGGGLEIALACHMRICSTNALFAFPEINHGIIPGLGGIKRINELSHIHEAIKFILSGDMINADEAKTMNLVDLILPDEELISYSLTLLRKMTSDRNIKVINYVMKAIHNTRKMNQKEALREETRMFCELAQEERRRRAMSNEE